MLYREYTSSLVTWHIGVYSTFIFKENRVTFIAQCENKAVQKCPENVFLAQSLQ